MLRCWGVFILNFELFGVSDSLGEMIRAFSVGNVELIFARASKKCLSYKMGSVIILFCVQSQNAWCKHGYFED